MHANLQRHDAQAPAAKTARAHAPDALALDGRSAPLQQRQRAADASPRVAGLQAQAAALQRRPATPAEPVVQRLGFGALGSALWSLGSSAVSLVAAHPWISLGLAVGGGLAYAYSQSGSGLRRRPGQLDVNDIPRDQLWRMYLNPMDHRQAEESKDPGGLYDRQKSPGFQQGMSRAVLDELTFSGGHLGRRVDFAEYTRLHDLVSSGLRSGMMGEMDTRETTRGLSSGEELFLGDDGRTYSQSNPPPSSVNITAPLPPVSFPINDWSRDPTPLAPDLLLETIGGTPMVGNGALNSSAVKQDGGGRLTVNYGIDRGPVLTQQILDRYYQEVDAADTRAGKLRAIVKAIRAIHVTHAFRDANGRLNVQILLNKFLLEQGFDPTILPEQGLGIFGGGFTVDQLALAVSEGSTRFRGLAESKKGK
jgi:hypothetical protein